jgi:Ca2+-binding EF-hand superfamily protein
MIDADGNGVITMQELGVAVRDMGHGMLESEVLQLLQGLDIDGDGNLVGYINIYIYILHIMYTCVSIYICCIF